MKEYRVAVRRTVYYEIFYVEADNQEDAEEKAEELFYEQGAEVVEQYDDFTVEEEQ